MSEQPEASPVASVTRRVCERYDVRRGRPHCDWAIITLDERGGVLAVLSDYGSWAHAWPHHGRPTFKHFLADVARDRDYFLGKLCGRRTQFDAAATLARLRGWLAERRRREPESFSREQARAARDALRRIAEEHGGSEDLFVQACLEDDDLEPLGLYESLSSLSDGWPVRTWPGDAALFVDRLWPTFAAALEKELEATGT